MFTELVQTHQQSIGDSVEFGPQPVRITPDFQQDSGPLSPSADADLGDALEAETVQSLAVDSQHELRRVPVAGVSDVLFTRADYNKALFEARLNNIGDSDLKFPWETGVMGEIFFENSDAAGVPSLPAEYLGFQLDQHAETPAASSSTAVRLLSGRDLELPFYSFAIRVKPDKDLFAELEAIWAKAILKWSQVFEVLGFPGQLGDAVDAELHFSATEDQGTVLRDALGVKSPRTALKRAQTLLQYLRWVQSQFTDWDPWSRARCLGYLSKTDEQVPAPSRGTSFLEALRFAHHVMQIPIPDALLLDPQLKGRAQRLALSKLEYNPARPLRAAEVATLERLMLDELNMIDKYMLGAVLFAIFSRSRWSDLQHIHRFWVDRSEFDGQIFGFIETETAHHKTATSLKKKMRFMPIVCPILGITSTDWTEQWFGTFAELQVDMASCPFGPICRAPGLDGVLGVRSCTSDEISSFINRVLNTGDSEKLTSHSLKHTTLSWSSSYGIDEPARTLLGHHTLEGTQSMAVYSRDMLTRPLQLYCSMLKNIREDHFRPDESRTSRLIDLMKIQQGAAVTGTAANLMESGMKTTREGTALETEDEAMPTSPADDKFSESRVPQAVQQEANESEDDDLASTSSSTSDASESEGDTAQPSTNFIPGPVLRNRRSKVVHKCGQREGMTFCHRITSDATFEYLEGGCSTLNARCSRCFKGQVVTTSSAMADALDAAKAKRLRRA